jgi:uncharacterized OsmC-like protein
MARKHRPIVVTRERGVRFAVDIGEHRLTIDQPADAGGDGAGPAPLELLGASLGACVAFYVHQFLASRHLPGQGVRIEVAQHSVPAPSRIGRFDVRVVLPQEIPDQVRELVERVARSCPAHNTFANGADVSITVDSATTVG